MAQRDITFFWDVANTRLVNSQYQHGVTSARALLDGVHMGDTLTVRLVTCEVVGGFLRSRAVSGSPPTASMALVREDGALPSPDATARFSDGGESTREIPYRDIIASGLSRALNELSSIQAEGGVDVSRIGRDHYEVRAKNFGVVGYSLTATGGIATVASVAAGGSIQQQRDHIFISSQRVVAPAALTMPLVAPSVSVSDVETGDASKSAVQSVTLAGDVEGGTFRLSDTTNTTWPISWNATAGEVAEALNVTLDPLVVSVTKEGRSDWRVIWSTPGAQPQLTGDADGLRGVQGVSGTLDLSADGASVQGGRTGYDFTLECTVGTGGAVETLFAEPVRIGPARA